MSIQTWWPQLPPATRDWLIAHNGSAVPDVVREQIEHVGGPARSDPWWIRDEDSAGPSMPDAAIDWIEEAANEELHGTA
jgi:hypothetical protein